MKTLKFAFLSIFFFSISYLPAQNDVPEVNSKATIYILRTTFSGPLFNFKYFIDDTYIGKCNFGKYLKLELDPGKYLIWAKAENRSFVEANVEGNKTYLIIAEPRMGVLYKPTVKLKAFRYIKDKELKRIKKCFSKHTLYVYDNTFESEEEKARIPILIARTLAEYENKFKYKRKKVEQLNQAINLDNVISNKKQ